MGGVHLGPGCQEPTKSEFCIPDISAHRVAAACFTGLSAGWPQALHSHMGTMGPPWVLLASVPRPDLSGAGFLGLEGAMLTHAHM